MRINSNNLPELIYSWLGRLHALKITFPFPLQNTVLQAVKMPAAKVLSSAARTFQYLLPLCLKTLMKHINVLNLCSP